MKARLTAAGVAEDHLILDEEATNTWENTRFVAAWWQANGRPPLVAVSDPGHLRRCRLMLWAQGVPANAAPAPASGDVRRAVREAAALVVQGPRAVLHRWRHPLP